jgi:hypothetical protein
MSASSASSRSADDSPEASRTIGACVYSRMAAISSAGSTELRVAWRTA